MLKNKTARYPHEYNCWNCWDVPLPTPTIFAPSADTPDTAADLALLQNTAFNNSGATARLCATPLALVYSSDDRNPAGIFPFLPSILSLSCSPPSWVSPLSVPNLHFPSVSISLVPLCCSLFLILLFSSTSFLPFSSSVVPTPFWP